MLDSLHSFEDAATKDGTPVGEATDLVRASAVNARPVAGLMDKGVRDANAGLESSPQTRPSELGGICQRNTLHVLRSRHSALSTDAKHAPAKSETMTDAVKTTSAMSPECAFTPPIMPLVVSSSQTSGPSGPAQTVAEVSEAMGKRSGAHPDSRATTASNESNESMGAPDGRPIAGAVPGAGLDGYPSSAGSASLAAYKHASTEISDADQLANASSAKSLATQMAQLQASATPHRGSSNGLSASGSASTSTIETGHVPFAGRDALFEQGKTTGDASAATLKPGNLQHTRPSIRETAVTPLPLKPEMVTPAMHVAAASGTQAQAEAPSGQFASSPGAGAERFPSGNDAASGLPHQAGSHEPFVSIDAGTDETAAKWISAGGHRAEAGFQDSSLGWVSVRAQAGAGGIHAAVIPSSDAAAQVLGSHLAGLNAHMANRYENLNPITLSASDMGWSSRGAGQEMAQGNEAYTGHRGQSQQGSADPEPARIQVIASSPGDFTDEARTSVPMHSFNSGVNRLDGHVSFVV